MSSIKLEVVTAERIVYTEDVDTIIAPGAEGQLGILPHHAPDSLFIMGEFTVCKETDDNHCDKNDGKVFHNFFITTPARAAGLKIHQFPL